MFSLLWKTAAILAALVLAAVVALGVALHLLTTRSLPDERIAVGKLELVVERTERCWDGCSIQSTGEVIYDGDDYTRRLLPAAAGMNERLFVHQALVFPKRRMLLTVLYTYNHGEVVVGIEDAGKAPSARVLAGALELPDGYLAREGADPGLVRPAFSFSFGAEALYEPASAYSYHDRFWIDYAREALHPVADVAYIKSRNPVGLTADRKTLLVLYPSTTEADTYMLCSAGGPDGAGECAVFEAAADSVPDLKGALASIPVPVPNLGVGFVDARPRTAALAAWLAPLFVLDRVGAQGEIQVRPGVKILRRVRVPVPQNGNPATGEGNPAFAAPQPCEGGEPPADASSPPPDPACALVEAVRRARRLPAPVT